MRYINDIFFTVNGWVFEGEIGRRIYEGYTMREMKYMYNQECKKQRKQRKEVQN